VPVLQNLKYEYQIALILQNSGTDFITHVIPREKHEIFDGDFMGFQVKYVMELS